MLSSRHALPIVLAVLLLAPVGVRAAGPQAVDLPTAEKALDDLEAALKHSRTPAEIVTGALDEVGKAWRGLTPPVAPPLALVPEDADAAQRSAIEAENQRLAREHEKEVAAFEKHADAWRRKATSQLLRALAYRMRGPRGPIVREDVGIHAAKVMAATGEVSLWKSIRKDLQVKVFKQRLDVSQPYLDAVFETIARLGDPEALSWMADEYVHTRASPDREVDQLIAAQKTFLLFPLEKIPSSMRYDIVRKMVTLYAGTESTARQSSNDPAMVTIRRFWDRIRNGAIAAVQHLTGTPRNEDGQALSTMLEFQRWFRDHKSARDPVWTQPEPHE